MTEEREEALSSSGQVARRSFLRKALVGAAFAAPVIWSLTKTDVLVKSAMAQTNDPNPTPTPTSTPAATPTPTRQPE